MSQLERPDTGESLVLKNDAFELGHSEPQVLKAVAGIDAVLDAVPTHTNTSRDRSSNPFRRATQTTVTSEPLTKKEYNGFGKVWHKEPVRSGEEASGVYFRRTIFPTRSQYDLIYAEPGSDVIDAEPRTTIILNSENEVVAVTSYDKSGESKLATGEDLMQMLRYVSTQSAIIERRQQSKRNRWIKAGAAVAAAAVVFGGYKVVPRIFDSTEYVTWSERQEIENQKTKERVAVGIAELEPITADNPHPSYDAFLVEEGADKADSGFKPVSLYGRVGKEVCERVRWTVGDDQDLIAITDHGSKTYTMDSDGNAIHEPRTGELTVEELEDNKVEVCWDRPTRQYEDEEYRETSEFVYVHIASRTAE